MDVTVRASLPHDTRTHPGLSTVTARGDRGGATVTEPLHDAGGGRLVATVTDAYRNVLGLLQDR